MKERIIGVKAQMSLYNIMLFGLKLCERILCITDNLSKTLQTQSLSASEVQKLARLTSDTLKGMRTDQAFELFYQTVEHLRDQTETAEPSLPRRRKAPKRYEVGEAEGYHSPTVEDHYRRYYFKAIDFLTSLAMLFIEISKKCLAASAPFSVKCAILLDLSLSYLPRMQSVKGHFQQ